MNRTVRYLLAIEGAVFLVAALVHFEVLFGGYGHRRAGIAESVLALVLLVALAATWLRPRWTRALGLAAQAFALLGTLVGIVMIAIGVGPRTVPDVVYHLGVVALLAGGLVFTARTAA